LFGDENIDMLGAERYFERWKYLKKVKIPTIESMRYVGFGKVVMGDMTASGSNFFGKSEILKLENEVKNGEHRHLSEAENRFLALDDKLVVLEIKKLLNLAWGKDVDLPYDNEEYTILLDKGGEFKVIVADLSCLWRRKFRTIEIYKLEEQKMIERFFKHRNLLFGVMG